MISVPLQERVEIAVLVDQRRGGLDADAGRAGHVVDRVAHQGLIVDNLVGTNAPFFFQRRGIVEQIFSDVVNPHVIGDQLPAVFVAGDDDAITSQHFGLSRDGGQQIVRFE